MKQKCPKRCPFWYVATKLNVQHTMRLIFTSLLLSLSAPLSVHAIGPYTTNTDTVVDQGSGLEWQKDDDGQSRTWSDALDHCENSTLDSKTDWRLPNGLELASIVDDTRYNPAIDPAFSSQLGGYWAGSSYASSPEYAWNVEFSNGSSSPVNKTSSNFVRCVRGGEQTPPNNPVVYQNTGLAWQQADDGQTRSWADALAYCENLTLGSKTDWRLPDVLELASIVDDSRYHPAIDPAFSSQLGSYWSGSNYTSSPENAWNVEFSNGSSSPVVKTSSNFVRCVRNGVCESVAPQPFPTTAAATTP